MTTQTGYTKTTPDKIGKDLKELFNATGEQGAEFVVSAGKNLIILVPRRSDLAALNPILEHFMQVYPARFFVVYLEQGLKEIEVALSVQCHMLGKDKHACAEVVMIGASSEHAKNVQSILRANALPGRLSELFIYDLADVDLNIIELVASLCDRIVIDSSEPKVNLSLVSRILPLSKQLADLEWVRLGLYREQISSVFRRSFISSILGQVSEINIEATAPGNALPSPMLLLAGWLLDGLGLKIMTYSKAGFECKNARGEAVLLNVKTITASDKPKVTNISFNFRDRLNSKIVIQRSNVLEIIGATGTGFRLKRALEDDSLEGCINRYFLIGESIKDYDKALKNALELQSLSAGFLVD